MVSGAEELVPELVGLVDEAKPGENVGRGRLVADDIREAEVTGVALGEMLGLVLAVTLGWSPSSISAMLKLSGNCTKR